MGRWSASFTATSQRRTLSSGQIHGIFHHIHHLECQTSHCLDSGARSNQRQKAISSHSTCPEPPAVYKISPRGVFLATGGTNPAHSLRILLLRAGIEPNPGPPRKSDSSPPCETCHGTIKKGVSRFRCAALGCDKACHLKPDCSYITRAAAMKKNWHCTEHRTPSSPDRPSLPIQDRRIIAASSNELCPACQDKLKNNPIQ